MTSIKVFPHTPTERRAVQDCLNSSATSIRNGQCAQPPFPLAARNTKVTVVGVCGASNFSSCTFANGLTGEPVFCSLDFRDESTIMSHFDSENHVLYLVLGALFDPTSLTPQFLDQLLSIHRPRPPPHVAPAQPASPSMCQRPDNSASSSSPTSASSTFSSSSSSYASSSSPSSSSSSPSSSASSSLSSSFSSSSYSSSSLPSSSVSSSLSTASSTSTVSTTGPTANALIHSCSSTAPSSADVPTRHQHASQPARHRNTTSDTTQSLEHPNRDASCDGTRTLQSDALRLCRNLSSAAFGGGSTRAATAGGSASPSCATLAHCALNVVEINHVKALLFLYSVCHVVFVVHPSRSFDPALVKTLSVLHSARKQFLPHVRAAYRQCPAKEQPQLAHCTHPGYCVPEAVLVFPPLCLDTHLALDEPSNGEPKKTDSESQSLKDAWVRSAREDISALLLKPHAMHGVVHTVGDEDGPLVLAGSLLTTPPLVMVNRRRLVYMCDAGEGLEHPRDARLCKPLMHLSHPHRRTDNTSSTARPSNLMLRIHKRNAAGGTGGSGARNSKRSEHPTILSWWRGVLAIEDLLSPLSGNKLLDNHIARLIFPDYIYSDFVCVKAASFAMQRYCQDLPSAYDKEEHKWRMDEALDAYQSLACGPAEQIYADKLSTDCNALWECASQLCSAFSLAGRRCVLPLHPDSTPHTTGLHFHSACSCGRSRGVRSDAFSAHDVHASFYSQFECCGPSSAAADMDDGPKMDAPAYTCTAVPAASAHQPPLAAGTADVMGKLVVTICTDIAGVDEAQCAVLRTCEPPRGCDGSVAQEIDSSKGRDRPRERERDRERGGGKAVPATAPQGEKVDQWGCVQFSHTPLFFTLTCPASANTPSSTAVPLAPHAPHRATPRARLFEFFGKTDGQPPSHGALPVAPEAHAGTQASSPSSLRHTPTLTPSPAATTPPACSVEVMLEYECLVGHRLFAPQTTALVHAPVPDASLRQPQGPSAQKGTSQQQHPSRASGPTPAATTTTSTAAAAAATATATANANTSDDTLDGFLSRPLALFLPCCCCSRTSRAEAAAGCADSADATSPFKGPATFAQLMRVYVRTPAQCSLQANLSVTFAPSAAPPALLPDRNEQDAPQHTRRKKTRADGLRNDAVCACPVDPNACLALISAPVVLPLQPAVPLPPASLSCIRFPLAYQRHGVMLLPACPHGPYTAQLNPGWLAVAAREGDGIVGAV